MPARNSRARSKGITDPEEKREAITQTFYKKVFGRLVRESGAKSLLQGTILTDVDETVAGIKRQHNVFEQLGIDPQEAFGYRILEPLVQLRKDGVRMVGKALGLPAELFERIPFPGPALAARVIGEATPERIETVRQATAVVERLLGGTGAFQYMAILHEDRVTGISDGRRHFGQQIEVRCWDSVDARMATPTRLSVRRAAAARARDHPGGAGRGQRDLQPGAEAAVDDRGGLRTAVRIEAAAVAETQELRAMNRRSFVKNLAVACGAAKLGGAAVAAGTAPAQQADITAARIPRWRGFNLQGRFAMPGKPSPGRAFDEFDFADDGGVGIRLRAPAAELLGLGRPQRLVRHPRGAAEGDRPGRRSGAAVRRPRQPELPPVPRLLHQRPRTGAGGPLHRDRGPAPEGAGRRRLPLEGVRQALQGHSQPPAQLRPRQRAAEDAVVRGVPRRALRGDREGRSSRPFARSIRTG